MPGLAAAVMTTGHRTLGDGVLSALRSTMFAMLQSAQRLPRKLPQHPLLHGRLLSLANALCGSVFAVLEHFLDGLLDVFAAEFVLQLRLARYFPFALGALRRVVDVKTALMRQRRQRHL